MSKRTFAYFDRAWKQEAFTCRRCKWSGAFSEMNKETYNDVLDGACPECDTVLAVITLPDDEAIERAAAAGDAEGKQMLIGVLEKREKQRRYDHERLLSVDQLPMLDAGELELSFDRDGGDYVIRHGDRELWREPGFYGDWRRFFEIKQLVKDKYGAAFIALRPTPAATLYLLGEDHRPPILSPD